MLNDKVSKLQKSINKAKNLLKESAKIVGSRSLSTSDKEDWDGDLAEKRMRKYAGGPKKENIDWDKYGKGFVYVDPNNKENFSGYKLPFADVIDGELRATWGGVSTAMGVVNGAMGGVDSVDRKKAYNFLKGYYKKFEKEPPDFNE